ncbi:hypothetical protein WJ74_33785 [Burkholderia ubonensis]|nr:hypothetical protein WJ74_33785 [Burkholderia ubonensis]
MAEQAGYDAGMRRAAQEYAGRLLDANQFIVQAASRFEASFAEAVRKAVARIVETVPDSSIVERLMFTAYQDTFNEQMARIVVHADHYERVVEAWQHRGGARAISIVGDPSVNHRFCRIESTLGSVEVDVDTAIEAISDLVVRALNTARIEGKQVS